MASVRSVTTLKKNSTDPYVMRIFKAQGRLHIEVVPQNPEQGGWFYE